MYRSLLVPLDGSPTAERGLTHAIGLASALGARITVLHVLDVYPFFGHSGWSGQLELELRPRRLAANDLLATAALEAQEARVPVSIVLKECLEAHAGAEIVRQAIALRCAATSSSWAPMAAAACRACWWAATPSSSCATARSRSC